MSRLNSPRVLHIQLGANANMIDQCILTVEQGAEYEIQEVIEQHTTAGTDGGAVTLDVEKAVSAQAAGAGTTVLASTFNMKSTADTPVTKNVASGLATVKATRTLTAGQRLYLNFTGTVTALVGVSLDIVLKANRAGYYR